MASTEQTSTESPWLDGVAEPERVSAIPKRAGTLIVGGGLAGTALAASLARSGEPPLLLEAHVAAWGASGRNAGFVLAQGPRVAAHPAVQEAAAATRLRLAQLASRHAFGYRKTGSIRLAGDEAEAEAFRRAPRPDGVTVLEGSALPPPWNSGRWPAGWIDAGDGVVHPAALVRALRDDARAAGASVLEGIRVDALQPAAAHVRVRTPQGTVRADRVVLATNAWTDRLWPGLSIVPRRAQMLEARVEGALAWPQPVYARGGADYWRAMPDGRLLLGGCRDAGGPEEETAVDQPGAKVQAALDGLLQTLLGDRPARVTRRWAGIMGFTPDGMPYLGPGPTSDRVWLFAGFHGHGLGWAPGLADVMARALTSGVDHIPAPFRMRSVEGRR